MRGEVSDGVERGGGEYVERRGVEFGSREVRVVRREVEILVGRVSL